MKFFRHIVRALGAVLSFVLFLVFLLTVVFLLPYMLLRETEFFSKLAMFTICLMIFSLSIQWLYIAIRRSQHYIKTVRVVKPYTLSLVAWQVISLGLILMVCIMIMVLKIFFESNLWFYFQIDATESSISLAVICLMGFVGSILACSLGILHLVQKHRHGNQKKALKNLKRLVVSQALIGLISFTGLAGTIYFAHEYPVKGETDLNYLSSLYSTRAEWEARASKIQDGILKGAGLWPLPEKTPLNPCVHGRREYSSGYSVENVYLETLPGFYLAGNLYMPLNKSISSGMPIVLKPHGHFMENDSVGGRFRTSNQQLCATLARAGAAVFTYDMVGWGETMQVEHYSRYVFTLQLWNSIRVIDYMAGLSGVNPNLVAVTGASGGATQAIFL
ncbi:MAG: alpha/beta hydrolase family protein, partial [Promethearchaeota archaeon]